MTLAHPYTLSVQGDLEERQMRRLGAAVCLMWKHLPETVRADLLTQATMIHISGETTRAQDLRAGIQRFLDAQTLGAQS